MLCEAIRTEYTMWIRKGQLNVVFSCVLKQCVCVCMKCLCCAMCQSDVEAAREAYDAFLSHYPYCYGYWRKYADYEKRKGSKKKCLEVSAAPLYVHIMI